MERMNSMNKIQIKFGGFAEGGYIWGVISQRFVGQNLTPPNDPSQTPPKWQFSAKVVNNGVFS